MALAWHAPQLGPRAPCKRQPGYQHPHAHTRQKRPRTCRTLPGPIPCPQARRWPFRGGGGRRRQLSDSPKDTQLVLLEGQGQGGAVEHELERGLGTTCRRPEAASLVPWECPSGLWTQRCTLHSSRCRARSSLPLALTHRNTFSSPDASPGLGPQLAIARGQESDSLDQAPLPAACVRALGWGWGAQRQLRRG